jgi:hypothetical protein
LRTLRDEFIDLEAVGQKARLLPAPPGASSRLRPSLHRLLNLGVRISEGAARLVPAPTRKADQAAPLIDNLVACDRHLSGRPHLGDFARDLGRRPSGDEPRRLSLD